jgi:hypothetical protein
MQINGLAFRQGSIDTVRAAESLLRTSIPEHQTPQLTALPRWQLLRPRNLESRVRCSTRGSIAELPTRSSRVVDFDQECFVWHHV